MARSLTATARWRGAAILAVAIGSALASAGAGAATRGAHAVAPHLTWTQVHRIGNTSEDVQASLTSCSSDGLCRYGVLEGHHKPLALQMASQSATTWTSYETIAQTPPASNTYAMTCPSSTFCLVTTDSGYAYYFHGGRWSNAVDIDRAANHLSAVTMRALTCATSSFCVVGLSTGQVLMWNGSHWSKPISTKLVSITAIACPTTSFCLALGGLSHAESMETWHGVKWHLGPADPIWSNVAAVSCSSSTFCMAVGGFPRAGDTSAIYNGTAWKVLPVPAHEGPAIRFNSVSCPSATFCLATDSGAIQISRTGATVVRGDEAFAWGGTTWIPSHLLSKTTAGVHSAASCVSATFCTAIFRNAVLLYR